MNTIRRSNERGFAEHGWLKSFHTFSFADYYDPNHMSEGPLRVINEDRIVAGAGFGTHAHRDMEIITYMLEGELAHEDSMGNGSTIRAGDVQRMSAGSGIEHSEFNPSLTRSTHLLQIWITPNKRGIKPSYEEAHFDALSKRGQLRLLASPAGSQGSVRIEQDARLFAGLFDAGESAALAVNSSRRIYAHMARGSALLNGQELYAGDAMTVEGSGRLTIEGGRTAEILVFDLPS